MKRLLFVCARNRLRSPSAEAVFAGVDGIETSSAGTAPDAECVIDVEMVEWADAIFVMEARQKKFLQTRFAEALKDKTVVCLGVLDRYTYMQPELVDLLRQKMAPYLGRAASSTNL
ncbi:putative protein tyrosine phosphatase [Granulicella aggregans]|uniref:Phosphotyrosine protein phosphatase I domain-containing protein n=1 Tax=Granulicella aggregans TaxID=474949 RepID=A0A7W8E549_9BACT|nr:phosphotyrosine protein phosphatase [Granulicella aggregans]MBB5058909.1 putative protein tyrosine phosphatase [Granulicella aggregans]